MKVTSEELLNLLGLKVGDKIKSIVGKAMIGMVA